MCLPNKLYTSVEHRLEVFIPLQIMCVKLFVGVSLHTFFLNYHNLLKSYSNALTVRVAGCSYPYTKQRISFWQAQSTSHPFLESLLLLLSFTCYGTFPSVVLMLCS